MLPERQSPPAVNRGARSVVVGDSHSLRRAAVEAGADTVVVRGHGVRDALRRARLRPIYAGTVQGWMLDRRHLDDVMVTLERAGYAVRLEDSAPPQVAPPVTSTPAAQQARELGLW